MNERILRNNVSSAGAVYSESCIFVLTHLPTTFISYDSSNRRGMHVIWVLNIAHTRSWDRKYTINWQTTWPEPLAKPKRPVTAPARPRTLIPEKSPPSARKRSPGYRTPVQNPRARDTRDKAREKHGGRDRACKLKGVIDFRGSPQDQSLRFASGRLPGGRRRRAGVKWDNGR